MVSSHLTTINDDGSPSQSCHVDSLRIFRLIKDERHLAAHSLYRDVMERIHAANEESTEKKPKRLHLKMSPSKKKNNNDKGKDIEKATQVLSERQDILEKLEERCNMFRQAKVNLDQEEGWTLASKLFGVTTHYRREENGTLSMKIEGKMEGLPLFDQVAVLREVDLYYKWAPFCSSSLTIAHLNTIDIVGWFVTGLPHFGLMRDACFRAIGCDSFYEDGSILLVGQGIADRPDDANTDEGFQYLRNDPILDTLDLPEVPTALGSGRVTIRTFQAIINVHSPMDATTKIVANIDPNLSFIPQPLIDFTMKKLCGVLLAKLQQAAKKVSKDPIYNAHACVMRRDEDFYKGWLMEKFTGICKVRGWEMPPVACFELTEQQLELAEARFRKTHKRLKKSVDLFHSMSDEKLDSYLERNEGKDGDTESPNGTPPRLRSYSNDSDSVSELSQVSTSSNSTSRWKGNPLRNYLREVEERTQARKLKEIEKAREKAANRLKPKELSEDSRTRLQELRAAREKRLAGKLASQRSVVSKDSTKSESNSVKPKQKKDWATRLTSHSFFTQIFLMSVLTISLFAFLHLSSPFEEYMASKITLKLLSERREDLAAVSYMVFAGIMHYSLCYVSLMYAFSSLQLGMIAGSQAIKFFGDNIHGILAGANGMMVFLCAALAGWKAMFRWFKQEVVVHSWRDDAYATTRSMFTYCSTFLLTLLFLFSLNASKARKSSMSSLPDDSTMEESYSDISTTSVQASSHLEPSSTKSAPILGSKEVSKQIPKQRDRAQTFNFEPIDEDRSQESNILSLPGRVNKKGKRFKLRKNRRKKAQQTSTSSL